jgi:hypothetical protein
MVVYCYNPSILEAEARGLCIRGQPVLHSESLFKKKKRKKEKKKKRTKPVFSRISKLRRKDTILVTFSTYCHDKLVQI